MTVYSDVGPEDTDVGAFLCQHLDAFNILHLPSKMWVARQDSEIVVLLMLKTMPYTSLDLIVANPDSRPFMRIIKLWRMAEAWLKVHNVPMVAISIPIVFQHAQAIVRRIGFVKIGEEANADGLIVETIYGKMLRPAETVLHA